MADNYTSYLNPDILIFKKNIKYEYIFAIKNRNCVNYNFTNLTDFNFNFFILVMYILHDFITNDVFF